VPKAYAAEVMDADMRGLSGIVHWPAAHLFFVALSRLRTAGGVAGVLRLASRANMVVDQNVCVNTLVGPPVL